MPGTDLKQGFYVGEWEVQPLRSRVLGPDGPVHIEPRVMDVLVALAARPGEVVERSELLETVWEGRAMSDEPLNRCISKLRNVFEDSRADAAFVETVPRRGYRLVAPVRLPSAGVQPGAPRRSLFNTPLLAAAVVLLLVIGVMVVVIDDPPRTVVQPGDAGNSVAVFPFDLVGGVASEEWLSEGLADEIMNRLVRVAGLKVAARTSVANVDASGEDIGGVLARLGVSHMLDGRIRMQGDTVVFTVYLVDREGNETWNATYESDMADVSDIQDDIANDIVRRIAPGLAGEGGELRIQTDQATQNRAAYLKVLEGRHHLARRGEDSLRRSINLFQQALELDASYSDAYVGLATAYAVLPFYSREAAAGSFDLALAIIEKGAQADASVDFKAAGILAFILYHSEWRWIEAESAFRKALQYTPNDADLLNWYSVFLAGAGRIEQALETAQRARDLDPLSPVANQRLAVANMWAGNDDLASEYFEVANGLGMPPETQPEAYAILLIRRQDYAYAHQLLLLHQAMMGRSADWVDALFAAMQEPELRGDAAAAVLAAEQSGDISPLHLFAVWVYLGEAERAVDAALALSRRRIDFNSEFLFSAEASVLRRHPRFGEVIRSTGLDTYWDYFGWPAACEPRGVEIMCR